MKALLESQIRNGTYQLKDILEKIDTFWAVGKITAEDRIKLTDLAREKAAPSQETNILAKLIELEQRILVLEKAINPDDPSVTDPTDPVIEEYTVGKWYHNGDKAIYNGEVYMVTNVPENNVCVWNPDEMPAYWTLVKPFMPETSTTEEEPTETIPQHEGTLPSNV